MTKPIMVLAPIDMSGCLHFRIVTMKFIAPNTDEIPRIFSPNIHMSAAGPGALIDRVWRSCIPSKVGKSQPD